MGAFVINSGGLGAAGDPSGLQIACGGGSYLSWLTDPNCWGTSYEDWQTQFYGTPAIPATVVAVPGAPSDLTALPDTTGDAAQALSNAAISQTQGNVQAFVNTVSTGDACAAATANWPFPFAGLTCTTWALMGAAAIAAYFLVVRR